jgi:hypothetical protein
VKITRNCVVEVKFRPIQICNHEIAESTLGDGLDELVTIALDKRNTISSAEIGTNVGEREFSAPALRAGECGRQNSEFE